MTFEQSNFRKDIETVAAGEPIEGIVVGDRGWSSDKSSCPVQAWEDVRDLLDYEYDTGYGGMDCHAIYAWTPTRVLLICEYDGSTAVVSVPRNPTESRPASVGGG